MKTSFLDTIYSSEFVKKTLLSNNEFFIPLGFLKFSGGSNVRSLNNYCMRYYIDSKNYQDEVHFIIGSRRLRLI